MEYFDIDGNPTNLRRLCRKEPEWATSRITAFETELAALREENERLKKLDGYAEGYADGMRKDEEQLGELITRAETAEATLVIERKRANDFGSKFEITEATLTTTETTIKQAKDYCTKRWRNRETITPKQILAILNQK